MFACKQVAMCVARMWKNKVSQQMVKPRRQHWRLHCQRFVDASCTADLSWNLLSASVAMCAFCANSWAKNMGME